MKCPFCFYPKTRVLDKRDTIDKFSTRRRRICLKCNRRFTTYERAEQIKLFVIKKDGRRQPFQKEKIKQGIVKACEKLPIAEERIDRIVNQIEAQLRRRSSNEVQSKLIGELVIRKLKRLSNIAYLRFASVYKQFADLSDFQREIRALAKEVNRATSRTKG